MRLEKLTIAHFKNLHNFSIDFSRDTQTMVLIGQNGSGKSTLLEALILIFRDLDLGHVPAFTYVLDYLCRGYKVHIDADLRRTKKEQVLVTVDGNSLSYRSFFQHKEPRYLPEYVFGYYSGSNENMQELFEKHQERFYKDILHGIDVPRHPLIYAQPAYRQFALLSFFIEQDEPARKFLADDLGIQGIDSVLFVIGEPPWSSEMEDGDPRFWYARGMVQRTLDYLYELAEEPLRRPTLIRLDYRTTVKRECLYLSLPNQAALQRFYNVYGSPHDFFDALACIEMSGMLVDVRIKVRVRNANGSLTFRNLSEGEQQLLMVLGLLRFTRGEEALFLLDEPDTHLNPAWSIQYLDLIDQLVGQQQTSQLLMSTHNPLVISSLKKYQVRIMQCAAETGAITATWPYESPQGMGVAAILTSDLFGLRSTLDQPTQRLVDQRRELAVKKDLTGEDLNREERKRLSDLNTQLQDLDFSITTQDPLYHDFVREMTRREDPVIRESVTLTDDQRKKQRELTRSILRELKEKKGSQE